MKDSWREKKCGKKKRAVTGINPPLERPLACP